MSWREAATYWIQFQVTGARYRQSMQTGFRPLGTFGLDQTGTCGLCGVYGRLSVTHVPPHGAGNDQAAATMGTRADEGLARVQPGTYRDGGVWKWLLCEVCNMKVGRYDEEFIRWWRMLWERWSDKTVPKPGAVGILNFTMAKPGAFIRSVLGGMFAMNPHLRPRYPDVAEAILRDDPVAMPSDLRLQMSLFFHGFRYVIGQTMVGVSAPDFSSITSLNVEGEWAWPPFCLALVDPNGSDWRAGAMDISEWMLETSQVVRDVKVKLGVLGADELYMSRFQNEA